MMEENQLKEQIEQWIEEEKKQKEKIAGLMENMERIKERLAKENAKLSRIQERRQLCEWKMYQQVTYKYGITSAQELAEALASTTFAGIENKNYKDQNRRETMI